METISEEIIKKIADVIISKVTAEISVLSIASATGIPIPLVEKVFMLFTFKGILIQNLGSYKLAPDALKSLKKIKWGKILRDNRLYSGYNKTKILQRDIRLYSGYNKTKHRYQGSGYKRRYRRKQGLLSYLVN